MRRPFLVAFAGACLLAPVAVAADTSPAAATWAKREIKLVVGQGLMAQSVATFRPNAPLTQAALSELIAGLRDGELPSASPASPAPAPMN